MLRQFFSGMAMLARGFGFWGRRPGAMALGLIPAAIVFVVMFAGLVVLGVNLAAITDWATPFADAWPSFWAVGLRIAVGTIAFGGAVVLAAVTFTAVTLVVGDPFYERIWRAVEQDAGGPVPDRDLGFWRVALDGIGLIGLGVVTAIVVAIIGFVPVVGSVVAPVAGVVLSGRLLAVELVSRPFQARGMTADARRAALRGRGAQVLGFGVATQLLFMIPLGAIFTMPAAVAGSTMLAREALDARVPVVE